MARVQQYEIIMTPESLADLREIADYIRQNSPTAAETVAESIIQACKSLAYIPEKFVRVAFSRKRSFPINRMVVNAYLVFYRIEADAVYVTMIRHGARRPPRRFD